MRFPKLHLRDLFWLVLVAAILCGWWSSRSQSLTEIERLRSRVEGLQLQLEAVARYDKLFRQHEEMTAPKAKQAALPAYFPVIVNPVHKP